MRAIIRLVVLATMALICCQSAFAYDVLSIAPTTTFSNIMGQVDSYLLRNGSGNPNSHLGCPLVGVWYYDTTGHNFYYCSATDGTDTPSGTTWTLFNVNSPGDMVTNDNSNTYTGVTIQDLSGSGITLKLPTKTDPVTPSVSSIWLSGTTGTVAKFRDNAGSPATHVLMDTAGTSPMTGALNMNSNLISNLSDPVSAQDAATKNWVLGNTFTNTLTSAHLLVGNGSNVATDVAVTGDLNITNAGATTVLKTNGTSFAPSATIDTTNAANITTGTIAAARLPNPSSSTLGGIQSFALQTHKWISSVSTSGIPAATQPAFSDLTGQVSNAQLPTLTSGDIFVGNGSNVPTDVTMHGDATITNAGSIMVTATNGTAFAPSATIDTTNAANITTGVVVPAVGGTGLNTSGTDSTQVLHSNGTGGFVMGPSGGSSAPFVPPQVIPVPTVQYGFSVVDATCTYEYLFGPLVTGGDASVTKIKIADGSVVASLDLGALAAFDGILISNDGTEVYPYDGTDWFKVSTASMTLVHHSTLAASIGFSSRHGSVCDLSPDGSTFIYVSQVDDNVYSIDTTTYVVTSTVVGHSDGSSFGTMAVCFDNGSSANFDVSYLDNANVDLYSGGSYTSTLATTAAGTPRLELMRSGINGNLFMCDRGTSYETILSVSGSIFKFPMANSPAGLSVDTQSDLPIEGEDVAIVSDQVNIFWCAANAQNFSPINAVIPLSIEGVSDPVTLARDGSFRVFGTYDSAPVRLFSLSGTYAPPPTVGTSTLSTGGTITVTCPICTASSIIGLMDTSSSMTNVGSLAITARSAGSFTVTSTNSADTSPFTWWVVKP